MLENIQTLTVSLFGPIFFVVAGMRVDILQINSVSAVLWESTLVGFGLNLKGGTDVIVAIVGAELGLLTARLYTMYTVVAILTVLFTPTLLAWLELKAPPTDEEQERLEREEASRRSYLPQVERALVPVLPQLFPILAAGILEQVAAAKNGEEQLFDITEFVVNGKQDSEAVGVAAARTQNLLSQAEAFLKELGKQSYGLVVLGGVDRGGDNRVVLGATVHSVLTTGNTPAVVLIKHE